MVGFVSFERDTKGKPTSLFVVVFGGVGGWGVGVFFP